MSQTAHEKHCTTRGLTAAGGSREDVNLQLGYRRCPIEDTLWKVRRVFERDKPELDQRGQNSKTVHYIGRGVTRTWVFPTTGAMIGGGVYPLFLLPRLRHSDGWPCTSLQAALKTMSVIVHWPTQRRG